MNDEAKELLKRAAGLYDVLGACHPKLARGQVWCRHCGATMKVSSADCFRRGWPRCCGETMTIDAPDERHPRADND